LELETVRCSEMLWGALAAKMTMQFPTASVGQIWVLMRDEFYELFDQLRVVRADGR
jgi:hypothetical protein